MRLTVVGCGDAFGSGGRLQTCYHVRVGGRCFLIDCGASAMIGLQREGLDPNEVGTIFISHLHGDHFAGLVWWLLHAQHVAKRRTPLTVLGPTGIEARFVAAAEALFPGSSKQPRKFDLGFVDMVAGTPVTANGIEALAAEVSHPSGAASHALRLTVGGKVIGFSGDTEWVESLLPIARGADLYISECYGYSGDVRYHLSWPVIERNLGRLDARRVLLTHMNADMLENRYKVSVPHVVLAEDGLVLEI